MPPKLKKQVVVRNWIENEGRKKNSWKSPSQECFFFQLQLVTKQQNMKPPKKREMLVHTSSRWCTRSTFDQDASSLNNVLNRDEFTADVLKNHEETGANKFFSISSVLKIHIRQLEQILKNWTTGKKICHRKWAL